LLAMLALLTVRIRSVFWPLVVAFNLVGAVDIIVDYYHGNQVGLAALAGELGATYAIPIIYVPLLMITHVAAFYLLLRHRTQAARTPPGGAAAVDGISGRSNGGPADLLPILRLSQGQQQADGGLVQCALTAATALGSW